MTATDPSVESRVDDSKAAVEIRTNTAAALVMYDTDATSQRELDALLEDLDSEVRHHHAALGRVDGTDQPLADVRTDGGPQSESNSIGGDPRAIATSELADEVARVGDTLQALVAALDGGDGGGE